MSINSITAASSSAAVPQAPAINTHSTRARVLEIIRNRMPVTTLFTPELKIDLGVFIQDQMLIHELAKLIASMNKGDSIAEQFDKSELLTRIKALFKQDPDPFLALLFEACADVLNEKPSSSSLKPAIEGRIFTLKNALVAQHTPKAICNSQLPHRKQDLTQIKQEGADFIRESLRLHLEAIRTKGNVPFREGLVSVSEQLIPFVQEITKRYLREHGKTCPDNPLTFRNPTGYNHHGLVAATVMEGCLRALGYATRLMGRSDLEPKVTLATAHNVVEVSGPDHVRTVIDPSYIQFHKDVCLEKSELPSTPVLLIEEGEVPAHVEKIMAIWKRNFQHVSGQNETVIAKLEQNDQLLSLTLDDYPIPKEVMPENLESWARQSFMHIWDLSTYTPILSDAGFHEIFYGSGDKHETFDFIKSMGLGPLTTHLSYTEIEKQLQQLCKNSSLTGKNSSEALTLYGQLPRAKREKYITLFDTDPRIKTVDPLLIAYCRSVRKTVNPQGKDLSVIYGCAGADCSSVLLATDASEVILLDLTEVPFSDFEKTLKLLKTGDLLSEIQIEQTLAQSPSYSAFQMRYMAAMSTYDNGKHHMNDLALKLFFSLRELGVNLNEVELKTIDKGVQINFPWQYHGVASPRKRQLSYMTADITDPAKYPLLLKKKIAEGFDAFYMKGGFLAPKSYPQFLPVLAKSIRPGGWLMTVDKTFIMETIDPQPCLEQHQLNFSLRKSDETRLFEELLLPPFDPLSTVPVISMNPERATRNRGSDLTYWALLTLRQKMNPM